MSLTMTEWGIPVTGMHSGLWLMYWDKCNSMMHILNNPKCIWPVHPSNWNALGAINIYWDQCMYWGQSLWTKYILHIFNLLCAVHPNYWDVLSDINHLLIWWASNQCHWMKHMSHVFNHDWMVNPSNWDALGTMNYVLRSMSLEEACYGHL